MPHAERALIPTPPEALRFARGCFEGDSLSPGIQQYHRSDAFLRSAAILRSIARGVAGPLQSSAIPDPIPSGSRPSVRVPCTRRCVSRKHASQDRGKCCTISVGMDASCCACSTGRIRSSSKKAMGDAENLCTRRNVLSINNVALPTRLKRVQASKGGDSSREQRRNRVQRRRHSCRGNAACVPVWKRGGWWATPEWSTLPLPPLSVTRAQDCRPRSPSSPEAR